MPEPSRVGHRNGAPARQPILDATTSLAQTHRWDALSFRDIAQAAGFSEDQVAEHFADPQACVRAAVENALARLEDAVERRTSSADAAWSDRVVVLVVGFLEFVVVHRERSWIGIVEPLADDPDVVIARTKTRLRLALSVAAGDDERDRVTIDVATRGVRVLWDAARRYLSDEREGESIDDLARSTIFLILRTKLDRTQAMRLALNAPPVVPD